MVKRALGVGSCLLVMASCSSSSSGSSSGGGVPKPNTPGEALKQLTPDQQQAFTHWQNALVKSCDANQAFGLSSESSAVAVGVDIAVLLKATGNSVLVKGADGSFALLGTPSGAEGLTTTSTSLSTQIDGQTTSASSASTSYSGFDCSVTLNGQPVYKARIAAQVPIEYAWVNGDEVQPVTAATKITIDSGAKLAEIDATPVLGEIGAAVSPTPAAADFVGATLGVSATQAETVFNPNGVGPFVLKIDSVSQDFWFDASSPRLIGPAGAVQAAFPNHHGPLAVTLRLVPDTFAIEELSNSADQGAFSATATLQVSAGLKYEVQQISAAAISAPAADSQACLSARVATLSGVEASSATTVAPSVREVADPCLSFDPSAIAAAYSNGTFAKALEVVLTQVNPSPNVQYSGWDGIFSTLAVTAAQSGAPIAQAIDPDGSLERFTAPTVAYFGTLVTALASTTQLGPVTLNIYSLAPAWALAGRKVDPTWISRLVKDADLAVNPFQQSVIQLLGDVEKDPTTQDQVLAFAETLSDNYKNVAKHVQVVAQNLSYDDWTTNVFSRILQVQPSLSDLQTLSARLDAIASDLSKTPALAGQSGDLTRAALNWLGSQQTDLNGVAKVFGALQNAEVPFSSAVAAEISTLEAPDAKLADAQSALSFAASLTPAYKTQAQDDYAAANGVGLTDWATNFYNSILTAKPSSDQLSAWNATLQAAMHFQQSEHALVQSADSFTQQQNESARLTLTQHAITEGWTDADFAAITQMATLARLQSACLPQMVGPGVSAALNCAGINEISREKGLLLDPTFQDRYGALATALATYVGELTAPSYFSTQFSLESSFFGSTPLWSACSNPDFVSRSRQLANDVSTLVKSSDFPTQVNLENQITTLLENCGSASRR